MALGPWTLQLTSRFGYTAPMIPKRGYHMHYARLPGQTLNSTVIDAEYGYVVAPMKDGLRLTTGAELANADAPRTPTQIDAAEAIARQSFPLGERVDPNPGWARAPACPT